MNESFEALTVLGTALKVSLGLALSELYRLISAEHTMTGKSQFKLALCDIIQKRSNCDYFIILMDSKLFILLKNYSIKILMNTYVKLHLENKTCRPVRLCSTAVLYSNVVSHILPLSQHYIFCDWENCTWPHCSFGNISINCAAPIQTCSILQLSRLRSGPEKKKLIPKLFRAQLQYCGLITILLH